MNDSMTLCGPPPRKGRRRSLFPICMTAARPEFDTLPVMKVTHYPLEPRDYKPFAQGIVAVDPRRLYLRLWAFETPPEPESRILLVLRHAGRTLTAAAGPEGVSAALDGVPCAPLACHPFTGDDLQGRYWGWLAEYPADLLGELAPGDSLTGNLYKCSDGRRPHLGSFFPMADPSRPLSPENDGAFVLRPF